MWIKLELVRYGLKSTIISGEISPEKLKEKNNKKPIEEVN